MESVCGIELRFLLCNYNYYLNYFCVPLDLNQHYRNVFCSTLSRVLCP